MPVMPTDQTAPAELELVREFVNTLDIEDDTDELDDRAAGALGGCPLTASPRTSPSSIDEADRRRWSRSARHCASCCSPTTSASAPPPEALAALNEQSAEAAIVLRFGADGAALVTRCGGVDSAIGRLLAIVHSSMGDRTWRAAQVLPGRGLPVGVLRPFAQPLRARGARWASAATAPRRGASASATAPTAQ